jgi:hypothetical protein
MVIAKLAVLGIYLGKGGGGSVIEIVWKDVEWIDLSQDKFKFWFLSIP